MNKPLLAQHVPLPCSGDDYGPYVFDRDDNMILQVRGWGHFQAVGPDTAEAVQAALQHLIVTLLNACHEINPANPQATADNLVPFFRSWKALRAVNALDSVADDAARLVERVDECFAAMGGPGT